MKKAVALIAAALLGAAGHATAFEVYKDYTPSTEVYDVTFVRVNPNRLDDYLQGLEQTWMSACDAGRNAGVTIDCAIYVSETGANRDFNMMLVMKQKNAGVSDPDQKVYDRINAEVRAKLAEDKQKQMVQDYEQMRQFWGQQAFRKVSFK